MSTRDHIGPPLIVVDDEGVDEYKRLMPRDPNELAKYQAALAALEVAEQTDAADGVDIDKASGALLRMCRRRATQAGAAVTLPLPIHAPDASYKGMSISEAAAKYLLQIGRKQRAQEIVDALAAGGFEMTAASPVSALRAALERRANNFGDVVCIAYGTWTHRDNLTDKERATLEHKARTARGMQAARERGVTVGGVVRITAADEAEMEKLIEQGWRITDIAKKFKVSQGSVRNRFKGERLVAIRERGENKDRPNLRLVDPEERGSTKA